MPIQVLMRSFKTLALPALVVLALFAVGAQPASAVTPAVTVGDAYACALTELGTISCWGDNHHGQLGNGTTKSSATPVPVSGINNAIQVDAGLYDACALLTDATVKCWGNPSYASLGTNAVNELETTPITIAGISGATKISAGEATNCAIIAGGSLKCWGYGYAGLLGNNQSNNSSTPVTVQGITGPVTDIGTGNFNSCAVDNGAAKCWGDNNSFSLYHSINNSNSVNPFLTATVAGGLSSGVARIQAGHYSTCAITTAGAVKCWGDNGNGQDGSGLAGNAGGVARSTSITSGAASVGYGLYSHCALVGDSAKCWGSNYHGQLGDGTTNDSAVPMTPTGLGSGVTSVDTGGDGNGCAIVNQEVKCWGSLGSGAVGNGETSGSNVPMSVLGIPSGASDVSTGDRHSCAIVSSALKCWGNDSFNQLGDETTNSSTTPVSATTFTGTIAKVATGFSATCVLVGNTIKCVGGAGGQLGNGSDSAASSAVTVAGAYNLISGDGNTFCAVRTTTYVDCWGSNNSGLLGGGSLHSVQASVNAPQVVSGFTTGATAVTIGYQHGCAIVSSAARCWGYNFDGSVTGTNVAGSELPAAQAAVSGITALNTTQAISVTSRTSCAIVTGGGVKCWGNGDYGMLGNGDNISSPSPVQVTGLTSGVTALAGSDYATCALIGAGSVKCWGNGGQGQLGNGDNGNATTPVDTGITNALKLRGAGSHFCATLVGGTVKCWGEGDYGQLGSIDHILAKTPQTVTGLSVFNSPPNPPAYVKQKIKPSLKLNGKIKKSGSSKISVPLKFSYAAPAGSNSATVCGGTTTISVKISKKKTTKLKAKFKLRSATCSFTGKIKLPKSFKGKKTKFKISMPGNADVLSYKSTKTLKLK
jgi:alpha-tubulin suppressor-like RCC1 family protein